MRYDMENCSALCVVCHDYMGKHPLEHTEWMMTRLGMKRLETLSQRAHAPYKWTPGEKQAMYKHYQAEAKRLRRLRMDGDRKYLPVENWYTKAKV